MDRIRLVHYVTNGLAEATLRRFVFADKSTVPCSRPYGSHDASVYIGDTIMEPFFTPEGYIDCSGKGPAKNDPRWPTHCQYCDYKFTEDDQYQLRVEELYCKAHEDTRGCVEEKLPAGAVWHIRWHEVAGMTGMDHKSVGIQTPHGKWEPDRATHNCDSPNRNRIDHKCWTRYGYPPFITVNKDNSDCTGTGIVIFHGLYRYSVRNGYLYTL